MIAATKAKVSPGKLLIDGKWSEGSGKSFDTFNPATGEVLTQVAEGGGSGIDQAVAAAREASDDVNSPWRRMASGERRTVLWRLAGMMETTTEQWGEREPLNHGTAI